MPTWQETLIIGTMLSRKVYGEVAACNASGSVNVAVWPQSNSGGTRAEGVIIRPAVDAYFAIDEEGEIGGSVLVAKLAQDVNYALPIHPKAHTFKFKAVTSTGDVQINWIVGR